MIPLLRRQHPENMGPHEVCGTLRGGIGAISIVRMQVGTSNENQDPRNDDSD